MVFFLKKNFISKYFRIATHSCSGISFLPEQESQAWEAKHMSVLEPTVAINGCREQLRELLSIKGCALYNRTGAAMFVDSTSPSRQQRLLPGTFKMQSCHKRESLYQYSFKDEQRSMPAFLRTCCTVLPASTNTGTATSGVYAGGTLPSART